MEMCEAVSFQVIKDGQILIEKRKQDKKVDPGLRAIPGGHCESGESPEETLKRELREELAIVSLNSRYVCTLVHRSEEIQKIHYFVVTDWTGTIENNEAEHLFWSQLSDLDNLDIEADKLAIQEYLRVYQGN